MRPRQIRQSSTPGRRYPRPEPPRRRQPLWPWLLLAVVVAIVLYAALPRLRRLAPKRVPRVGIVAGHWQYDPGATCDDGLREIDITLPIAQLVAHHLREAGYQAEVLPEYGPELEGYRGLALVSLHADSCIAGLSGYKMAARNLGSAAGASAELAHCLSQAYASATGLPFHHNTVTPAMTQYHAFYEIAPDTPAVIVELGFMGDDRGLLTAEQDRAARGIAGGVIAFLTARGQPPASPRAGPQ